MGRSRGAISRFAHPRGATTDSLSLSVCFADGAASARAPNARTEARDNLMADRKGLTTPTTMHCLSACRRGYILLDSAIIKEHSEKKSNSAYTTAGTTGSDSAFAIHVLTIAQSENHRSHEMTRDKFSIDTCALGSRRNAHTVAQDGVTALYKYRISVVRLLGYIAARVIHS